MSTKQKQWKQASTPDKTVFSQKVAELNSAIGDILDVYDRVATGQSGAGSVYADGRGTLCAVHVPVEMLERLAQMMDRPVHGRTSAERDSGTLATPFSDSERAALMNIINAANTHSEPIHYKVREAIDKARQVIQESDNDNEE
jgi:hypothetical protein